MNLSFALGHRSPWGEDGGSVPGEGHSGGEIDIE